MVRRRQQNELHKLYASQNIIWVKTSRKLCWGHVARMGDRTGAYRVLVGKPEGKKYLENLEADELMLK